MKELILATSNTGKIKELTTLLTPITCIPQKELGITDAKETGLSFIENAIIKARQASRQGGKPALADDSGLVVPALNGEPGIYSARFAGSHATDEANIRCLLEKMQSLPARQRRAYFYCAIALVQYSTDPTPLVAVGKMPGKITLSAQGNEGFGYDPIMYLPEHQATVAELPANVKNAISHRAQALNQLLAQLSHL